MVLDERVAKIPEDFRFGSERLAQRKRPAGLVPAIEHAAAKLLAVTSMVTTVHLPTFNMVIGEISLEMRDAAAVAA